MKNLVIREELQNLLPQLSESEYAGLEADIIANGCLSPLVVWDDIIVDGHHRYRICQAHGIPFETKPLKFLSMDDARFWVWTHQEHRRNLTLFQRGELALQFKQMLLEKGKENMSHGGSKKSGKHSKEGCLTSDNLETIDTTKEMAKKAGIGRDTMHKVEFLDKHADEETKLNLRQGKTTINREYKRAKEKTVDPKPKKTRSKKTKIELSIAEPPEEPKSSEPSSSQNVPCIEGLTHVVRTTLQNIRQDKTDHLLINLNMHFREGFIHELIVDGMAYIHEKEGDVVTEPIALELAKHYIKGFDALLKKQSRR